MIKQLGNDFSTKHLLPLLFLSIFSFFIWYGGPLLTIANYSPLAEPGKRFYCILLVFVSWFLKNIFFQNAQTDTPKINTNHPEFNKKLQALEGRFEGAIAFLKKTLISKHGKESSLNNLPWYLLLGMPNSGKTTLMANAGINFILAKQFKNNNLQAIPPSDICDWWVTRDLVVVDVPGCYLNPKSKQIANSPKKNLISWNHLLWKHFLTLTQKLRGHQALNGIIITLSLPELMNQNSSHFSELKERIKEVCEKFGTHLPFYFSITKCDHLPGFIDFFGDSGSDELSQAWGITLTSPKENETIIDVFTHRFNALIKRLNKQLIWRLHQERSTLARPQIKDFPLQIERLKENIINLLKLITTSNDHFNLQGVYLHSAIQVTEDTDANVIQSTSSQQSLQLLRNPVMPSRAYFVKQFLLQGLPISHYESTHVSTKSFQHRPLTYALSFGVITLAVVFFGKDINHSIKQTYAIQDGLAQYRTGIQQASQQGVHLDKALPLLNALQLASTNSSHSLLLHSDKAQQSASATYQQALQTIVLSEIKNDLEKYLKTTSIKSAENIYTALKAYLMLGDKEHLDTDSITNALKLVAPNLFTPKNTKEITDHIRSAFNLAWQPLELDPELINNARKTLTSLPPTELSFIILKNIGNYSLPSSIQIPTDINRVILNQIPSMYTADNFQTIITQDIESAAAEASQGNWVLGSYSASFNEQNSTLLAEQLRNLYIANYASAWESLLDSTKFSTPTDLAQTDTFISNLLDANSAISQWLNTIKQNTYFAPIMAASPKLLKINTFLITNTHEKNNSISSLFVSLSELHTILQKILTANDIKKASFDVAITRINTGKADAITQIYNQVNESPEPIKTWLNNLASKSWHYTLMNTSDYINQQWQHNIIPFYNTKFQNHFPVSPDATQSLKLDDFSKFLGMQGEYSKFFNTFLKPFINTTAKSWEWKRIDNEKISFSAPTLAKLENIENLQHIFFPNNTNELALKFTMQPLSLEKNTKSVHLEINGESLRYDRSLARTPQTLVWPSQKNVSETVLTLLTADNKMMRTIYKGDWGWFKLVNLASVKTIRSKELLLSFDIENHKANYLLFTQENMNPFLLENFVLPDRL